LIDADFSIFAVGERDEGGTFGILERLWQLSANLRVDPVDVYGRQMRVICLLDDDYAGRKAFSTLKSSYTPWQDIFKIQRCFPKGTRDPKTFGRMWERDNHDWKEVYCETEDLIERELLEYFVSENHDVLKSDVLIQGNIHHFDFDGFAKPKLVKFVRENASLTDMQNLVDLLKNLRWLLKV
jgi:hypothetical protein